MTEQAAVHPLQRFLDHRDVGISPEARAFLDDERKKREARLLEGHRAVRYRAHGVRDGPYTEADFKNCLDSTFPSGKYKGFQVSAVLQSDSQYVLWYCQRNLIRQPDNEIFRVLDLILCAEGRGVSINSRSIDDAVKRFNSMKRPRSDDDKRFSQLYYSRKKKPRSQSQS